MGRHMRNHETGSAETRTGRITPPWNTVDQQPTEPFGVNIARCRKCGDSLRAVAGGSWVGRQTNAADCRNFGPWPWSPRTHVVDVTNPDRFPWGWLLACMVGFGCAAILGAAFLATWLSER